MAYCRKCGKEINDGAEFCRFCGTKVKRIEENCTDNSSNKASSKEKKKRTKRTRYSSQFKNNSALRKSRLGGWAVFFSLIPIAHIIGGLFALIDIIFRRKRFRINRAVIALAISLCWTVFLVYRYVPLLRSYYMIMEQVKGPSVLSSKQLVATDDDRIFYVTGKMKEIKGKSNFEEEPKFIRYRVSTYGDYVVADGEMDYKKNWTIRSNGLAYGPNNVKLEYVYDDPAKNQEYEYAIYNYNEDNANDLPMKSIDSDSDGLTDYYELTNSETDPYNPDTNGNSVMDGDEDPDNDGLNNLKEQKLGSYALAMDSDGDELNDRLEKEYGTKSLEPDSDGDGFSDGIEVKIGSNPNDKADPDKGTDVVYNQTTDFVSGMTVDIDVETLPQNIASLRVYEIPKSYAISPEYVDGMIGSGICFVMDGEITEARVDIVLECGDYVEGENYYLYRFNEETYECEYVNDQIQKGNTISAKLNHFSDYFISSNDSEEEIQREFENRGIAFISDEIETACYDSYEEYLKNMPEYSEEAVLSVNVTTPNMNNDDSVDWGAYVDEEVGHTWTSYYYAGKAPELLLKKLDSVCSDMDCFGAIGFGPWAKKTTKILVGNYYFSKSKPLKGTIKLPKGFRVIREEPYRDPQGTMIYQDGPFPYKAGDIEPENMDKAYISMPFIINAEQLDSVSRYINTYNKKYILNSNNCTTFARDMLNVADIGNNFIDFGYEGISDGPIDGWYIGKAGSPAKTASSIQEKYKDEHVYVIETVENGKSKLKFTSKRAQRCALKNEQDRLIKMEEENEDDSALVEHDDRGSEVVETPNIIDSGETSRFIVAASLLGAYIGDVPILILQETESLPDREEQNAVQQWLDMKGRETGYHYFYYQVPKTVMDTIIEKNLPKQFVFDSEKEFDDFFENKTDVGDALIYLFYHNVCVRMTPNRMFSYSLAGMEKQEGFPTPKEFKEFLKKTIETESR